MILFAIPPIKTSPNSEILCQRPSDPKSRTFCTIWFAIQHIKSSISIVLWKILLIRRRISSRNGDDRSLEHHCGQGNRPMSFRGVKRRGNPLNRNKNRLTIATNRISPRAYYRAENLRYQFEQGQELLPQLRQIICLVEVGRDTHTRLE